MMIWIVFPVLILMVFHLSVLLIFNYIINPYEPSFFTKIFPYFFLSNLVFSKRNLNKTHFSIRVDINTSRENVERHNDGVLKLIKIANKHSIPVTFSISSEYLSVISKDVIENIKKGEHEVISHGSKHEKITSQDQADSIKESKEKLEDRFEQKVIGLIGPQGKHNSKTLKAAKENNIKYISSGSLSYLRYWSFPYPFKKKGIWLLGGSIKSDYQLYEKENLGPKKALVIWKEALDFRSEKRWYTQLEYHNSSTSEEQLNVLKQLFRYIENNDSIKPITQSDLVQEVESYV